MNKLLAELKRSLEELKLGFSGDLTMSDAVDTLKNSLYLERVPGTWAKRAWPSLRGLNAWLFDFSMRLAQLEEWQNNPAEIPKVTWLSGLANPQSFLTAICQVTAQANKWELDKLVTWTDPSKKMEEKAETGQGYYRCPCYKTEMRGPTYVFCAQLRTKALPAKWILAGCALIMDTSS